LKVGVGLQVYSFLETLGGDAQWSNKEKSFIPRRIRSPRALRLWGLSGQRPSQSKLFLCFSLEVLWKIILIIHLTYTQYKGLEIIDLTEQMNFNKGNAVKYICRAGFKNIDTEIEDLKKAKWYLDREISRLEMEK
jgi:Protein of unknwon function (DUF3310)